MDKISKALTPHSCSDFWEQKPLIHLLMVISMNGFGPTLPKMPFLNYFSDVLIYQPDSWYLLTLLLTKMEQQHPPQDKVIFFQSSLKRNILSVFDAYRSLAPTRRELEQAWVFWQWIGNCFLMHSKSSHLWYKQSVTGIS